MTFQLDLSTGVPVYRQIIDQVHAARASGAVRPGERLPTVRQLAVDLKVNPNTVVRAYRELELTGILTTRQGRGTFLTNEAVKQNEAERGQKLDRLVGEIVTRAGREGFTVQEVQQRLESVMSPSAKGGE
jgi:GntR family transcriptional regulator